MRGIRNDVEGTVCHQCLVIEHESLPFITLTHIIPKYIICLQKVKCFPRTDLKTWNEEEQEGRK